MGGMDDGTKLNENVTLFRCIAHWNCESIKNIGEKNGLQKRQHFSNDWVVRSSTFEASGLIKVTILLQKLTLVCVF